MHSRIKDNTRTSECPVVHSAAYGNNRIIQLALKNRKKRLKQKQNKSDNKQPKRHCVSLHVEIVCTYSKQKL